MNLIPEQPYGEELQNNDSPVAGDPEKMCSKLALQGILDMRKGKSGIWKRHFVVFNLSDDNNTIVCHRSTKPTRHPTKLDPVALFIPNKSQWAYIEADHKGGHKCFTITIPTGKDQENVVDMDDVSILTDMSERLDVHVRDSYDKDYAKAERKNKPLCYSFRFTNHQNECDIKFWLHTLEAGYLEGSKCFKVPSSYIQPKETKSLSSNVEAEFLAKKKGRKDFAEEFLVKPEYAYPNTKMHREQLRLEMNKKSAFYHDLRVPSRIGEEIGLVEVEVLQCIGLPKLDKVGEGDIFIIASCGSYAFRTDIIQGNANPMWLSKMRRACIFPLFNAFSRLYIGVFDDDGTGAKDDFAGRIALNIATMRPDTTYDVTLPLRESNNVYTLRKRGSVRIRFHVSWYSQRAMVLSYLPTKNSVEADKNTTITCCNAKAFENVSRVVHGRHMQGRFSMKMVKALLREINFTRIHVIRYMVKREARRLLEWRSPFISGFVFVAWMHSSYVNTLQYAPGHFVTLLLLYLWRNYAVYAIDNPVQNGFLAPSWEEIFCALLWGKDNKARCIEPMHNQLTSAAEEGDTSEEMSRLLKIADIFQRRIKVRSHRHRLKTFKNTFTGIEAVDCLVNAGCAKSREEAVKIGLDLSDKLKLFEHISHEHLFMDKKYYYRFLDCDENEYILRTHKPWGRRLFWLLGFINNDENFEHDQLEMPFSTGIEHPRFTVKDSLVIRRNTSKSESRQKKLDLKTIQSNVLHAASERALKFTHLNDEDKEAEEAALDFLDAEGNEDVEEDPLETFNLLLNGQESIADDLNGESGGPQVEKRKKPPLQNVDTKKKADKPIGEVLAKVNLKVRGIFLNVFNDRTYIVKEQDTEEDSNSKIKEKPKSGVRSLRSPRRRGELSRPSKESIRSIADANDKLLKTGSYSNSNKYVAKIGVMVLPLVEILYQLMYACRALFNIVTWRDPILTFWFTIFGPIVVIILHFFPWRLVLSIVGVALFGPQNWVLRVIRERKGIFPPDFDTQIIPVKKKKKNQEGQSEPKDEPVFSSQFYQNEPIDYSQVNTSVMRHILVPYSRLMYSDRFYDWPPEKEFTRVTADSSVLAESEPKPEVASCDKTVRSTKSIKNKSGHLSSYREKSEKQKKNRLFRRRKQFQENEIRETTMK